MSKRRKRSIEAAVTIDEFSLRWTLRSEPQHTTDGGYKGMTFSVENTEGSHRELIIEFPFPKKGEPGFHELSNRPLVSHAAVEAAIRQAMAAGWNPAARGKPLIFSLAENAIGPKKLRQR